MAISTVNIFGQPSSRMVLLKEINTNGLVFYTNFNSRKSQDLKNNPKISALFYWNNLERQIRIEGIAKKYSSKASDVYFYSRSKEKKISTIISPQSQEIKNIKCLYDKYNNMYQFFIKKEYIPRPEFWGGYILKPQSIEFWKGSKIRLHRRKLFTLQNNKKWKVTYLAP